MEQRNEMLKQMRLTKKQRRGDVQHLVARSFSRKQLSLPPVDPEEPGEISIAVPQLNQFQHGSDDKDAVSIGELSVEMKTAGRMAVISEEEQEQSEALIGTNCRL